MPRDLTFLSGTRSWAARESQGCTLRTQNLATAARVANSQEPPTEHPCWWHTPPVREECDSHSGAVYVLPRTPSLCRHPGQAHTHAWPYNSCPVPTTPLGQGSAQPLLAAQLSPWRNNAWACGKPVYPQRCLGKSYKKARFKVPCEHTIPR